MPGRVVEVLLIEDISADAILIREALQKSKTPVNLNTINDGCEALAYLQQRGPYANVSRPDLILLDFAISPPGGPHLLAAIKGHSLLRSIPVVVMTASDTSRDVVQAYQFGANSYVTKPVGAEQFVAMIRSIEEFWFTVAKLPPR